MSQNISMLRALPAADERDAPCPLERAQVSLQLAEQEEASQRQQLRALDTEILRLRLQLQEGGHALGAGKDPWELSRKRQELAERRDRQEARVAQARESVRAAGRVLEQAHRRALDLEHAIQREERMVAQWTHEIQATEQNLTRLERLLVETQARVDQAHREYAQLTGSGGITPGPAALTGDRSSRPSFGQPR